MSKATAKRLNTLANGLEQLAEGIVSGMELVVTDLTGTKRSRRRTVRKTARQTRRSSRQHDPVVIIKIVSRRNSKMPPITVNESSAFDLLIILQGYATTTSHEIAQALAD